MVDTPGLILSEKIKNGERGCGGDSGKIYRFSRERGWTQMITCVCGLIGSGKSTWCEKQEGIVSDFDLIGNKEMQLYFTLNEFGKGNHVYHITCFPTLREQEAFEKLNVEYVWINTSFCQSRRNIFTRRRKRDMENIEDVLNANANIMDKYITSHIDFRIINVFEDTEKW